MKKYLYTVLVLSLVLVLNADAKWPPVNSTVPGSSGDCLINDAGNVGAATCGSGGGAPTNATYITQTASSGLSAEQALSTLSTGLMFVTTTTGVITSKVPTDNVVLVGNGTDWELKAITDCQGSGKAVTYTAATNTFGCNTISGTTTFIGLTDVPASYTGQALKFTRVNAGETALEFATPSGAGTVTHTGALTADTYLVGNGTDDIKVATTQVLPRSLGGQCDAYVAPGTNNIQAVVDALPTTGGTICLGAGTYTMTGTNGVSIGDGGANTVSTRHGVTIRGVRQYTAATNPSPTILDATGVTSSAFLVLGAAGVEISDLTITGMHGANTYGVYARGTKELYLTRLYITTPNTILYLTGGSTGGDEVFNAMGRVENVWGNIDATAANGRGVVMTGSAFDVANFHISNMWLGGNDRSDSRCLYFAAAENVLAENIICVASSPYIFGKAFTYDYSISGYLPEQTTVLNSQSGQTDVTKVVELIGSPNTDAQRNVLINTGTYDIGGVNTAPDSPNPAHIVFTGYRVTESSKGLVLPASNYINFGTATPGTGSYGIRDNAGTIETKNSGGSWAGIGSGGSGDIVSPLISSEVVITNANTALTISKMHVITATSGATTNALPTCSGNTDKFIGIRVNTSSTKLVTIDGNASETIDGALTRIMWAGESAILKCETGDTNWNKIAGKTIPMAATLRLNTNQTGIPTGFGSATKVLFDTTDKDNTGLMADTTNSVINIIRPAEYTMMGVLLIDTGGLASLRNSSSIRLGGTTVQATSEVSVTAGGFPFISVHGAIDLAAGTNLDMLGWHSSVSNAIFLGGVLGSAALLSVIEVPAW